MHYAIISVPQLQAPKLSYRMNSAPVWRLHLSPLIAVHGLFWPLDCHPEWIQLLYKVCIHCLSLPWMSFSSTILMRLHGSASTYQILTNLLALILPG